MLHSRRTSHCWPTLLRTYGGNLPSSLASFHSNALGFSPCLPELVSGTVCLLQRLAAFLVSIGSPSSGPKPTTSHLRIDPPDLPKGPSYMLEPAYPTAGMATFLHPRITPQGRFRNINLIAIDYAFRPRLRSRLTLGRLS